jgi:N-acyl-D-amino-acid deacylase
MTRRFNTLIRGGMIYDGRGGEPFAADIGIAGNVIEAVGDGAAAEADQIVDARGCWVCPGFIDVHSHSDTYLLLEPSAASKIFQGVTTEIVGNCGASAAPRVGAYQMPSDWREKKYPGAWSSVAEYRRLFDQVKPAVNVRMLIGHNTLRAGVMGYAARQATAEEIRGMAELLERAMDEGGAGFSTGLIYAPGMFAAREELMALARTAARRGGIYATHMRSEGARLVEAIEEALEIGAQAGIPVQISHLKTSGRKNWHLLDQALAKIRGAREAGLDVAADRYPYTAANTDLDVILPEWAAGGGREEVLRRLRDSEIRRTIREEMNEERDAAYWEYVMVATTNRPENQQFRGRRLTEVARVLGVEPVDAALHLMETDDLHTTAVFFGMSEENMWRILAEPYVMIGSDASVRAPTGPLSHDHPHPRAYGAFPRFLRAAADGKTVSVAEAVRKMTMLPAERFGLTRRGVVAAGMQADIVVVDPAKLRDRATYEQPHQLAEGVKALFVNGVATILDSRVTGQRAGRFLD